MTMVLDGSGLTTTGVPNSGTAQASTSGTAITFTGIPSGVKRITVMFNSVSTNGSSSYLIRVGSGGVTSSGYSAGAAYCGTSQSFVTSTAGFILNATTASQAWSGVLTINLLNSSTNLYTQAGNLTDTSAYASISSGNVTLSGILDRVVVTTVNGTDTFDAGSINILYE